MNLLDTDSLSLLIYGHAKLIERVSQADHVAITVVTRIEILQGRFASVLKAANGPELLQAQQRLADNEQRLNELEVIPVELGAAAKFDQLLQNKKLKKIGLADLLIASIALAHQAVLVTRNRKHFQHVPGLQLADWTR